MVVDLKPADRKGSRKVVQEDKEAKVIIPRFIYLLSIVEICV